MLVVWGEAISVVVYVALRHMKHCGSYAEHS